SDAHAWNEVWLEDSGWVRVDPTAAVAPERIEAGMAGARFGDAGASWGLGSPVRWLYQLELTWDALNAKWNAWVLGYGPENQERLMEWLGMERPDWRKMMIVLIGVLLALLGIVSWLLLRRYRPPAEDLPARLFRRFIRKAGLERMPSETPGQYAVRLAEAGIASPAETDAVTRWYLAARYGPPRERSLDALATAVRIFRARRRAPTQQAVPPATRG